MRCFRYVQRRDSGHTGQRKLKIELSDRRKTGRAQMRYSEGEHSEGWCVGGCWDRVRCGLQRQKLKEEEKGCLKSCVVIT